MLTTSPHLLSFAATALGSLPVLAPSGTVLDGQSVVHAYLLKRRTAGKFAGYLTGSLAHAVAQLALNERSNTIWGMSDVGTGAASGC